MRPLPRSLVIARLVLGLLLISLVVGSPSRASAQLPTSPDAPQAVCSITWTNASGGAWSTASNWSPARVPNAADNVCITLDGTYTVTLSTSTTIASLTVANATGSATLDALVGYTSTVTVAGDVTNSDTINMLGGLTIGGTLTNTVGALLEFKYSVLGGNNLSADVANAGTMVFNYVVAFTKPAGVFTSTGSVVVAADATFQMQGADQRFVLDGGSLTNNRTFGFTNGTFVWNGGTIGGAGTATLQAARLTIGAGAGAGSIALTSGTLTGRVNTGQTVILTDSIVSGDLTNNGLLRVIGALTISGGTLTNAAGATIDLPTPSFFNNRITGNISNSGTVTVPGSQFLQLLGGTFTNIAPGTISGATARLNIEAGATLAGDGTITIAVINQAGTVRPGRPTGTLTIDGRFSQVLSTARTVIEVGGTTAGSYDVLAIMGSAEIDGVVEVVGLSGFVAQPGQRFDVITYAARSSDTPDVTIPSGLALRSSIGATALTLRGPIRVFLPITRRA